MTKRIGLKITALCCMLILLLGISFGTMQTAHAEDGDIYINDTVGLLSETEWQTLEARATEISDSYQCAVYIVVLDDYLEYGNSMQDACLGIYDYILPGYGQGRDATILLISMAERDYWIEDFGDFGKTALTDFGRESLEEAMLDDLRDNDWYAGFLDYLDQSEVILQAAANGTVVDRPPTPTGTRIVRAYGIALVIGVIAAFIICGAMKAQMKSARKSSQAEDYVVPSGVHIDLRNDQYINTTRTERRIQRSQSSGGGGKSSGGGGKF